MKYATRLGLSLPDGLSFTEWCGIGEDLGREHNRQNWWIGDWWAFGETHYGDRKAVVEAEGWDGPAFQTCANLAATCRSFETSRRREVLSFAHHTEVSGLPPAEADRLLDGAEAKNWSRDKLREEVRRSRYRSRAKAEADAEAQLRSAGVGWAVKQSDFRDWNPPAPVDLVLTDPPYGAGYLDAYRDLPHHADRWLGEEGWLAVMTGQAHLPDIMAALASGPLRYVWTFCLAHNDAITTGIHFIHVQNTWKPVILLRKGKQTLREWTVDLIRYNWETPGVVKLHKWQQEASPLEKLIRAMTAPNGLVADPFCGSGTTGIAAINTSRRFVGCDSDATSVHTATERLEAQQRISPKTEHDDQGLPSLTQDERAELLA